GRSPSRSKRRTHPRPRHPIGESRWRAFMRFANKVVVVTGAGSGIGAATARRFSEEGATVVLVGHHRGNIEKVAKALSPERTVTRVADVSKPKQVQDAIAATAKQFGSLHVLV